MTNEIKCPGIRKTRTYRLLVLKDQCQRALRTLSNEAEMRDEMFQPVLKIITIIITIKPAGKQHGSRRGLLG